jgi:SAM-dependent methyltransferase
VRGPIAFPGFKRRLAFALRLAQQRVTNTDVHCPYCGNAASRRLYRKFLLLEVRRCEVCDLMFRYPKAEPQKAVRYYDRNYDEFEQGCVTTLPSPAEAQRLVSHGFQGTTWDVGERLDLIRSAKPSGRFLDYGCSWGWVVAQATSAGFDAFGFEISRPRAAFGRQTFGLNIIDDPALLAQQMAGSVDVIYASHVLEHLPSIAHTFSELHRLLSDAGMLVIFVPNCGGLLARRDGIGWGPFANEAHTISFDPRFFEQNLPREGFDVTCFSSPYTDVRLDRDGPPAANAYDGDELMVVARKR